MDRFKVEKVTSSDMLLNKVDKYPGIQNLDIDKIEVARSQKSEVTYSYMIAGMTDFQPTGITEDVAETILRSNSKIKKTANTKGGNTVALVFNSSRFPFNDKRFRRGP